MPRAANEPLHATLQTSLTDAIESAESGLDEAVTAVPPRYWWLKRLAVAVGSILLALLAIRIGWGWAAARRLQAEIDKYVAAGQPIYPKDFDSSPVPDKDNAAKLYLEAVENLTLTSNDQTMLFNWDRTLTNMEENREAIALLLSNNAGVLQKLREARSRKAVDWKKHYRTPMMLTMMSTNISGLRDLSKILILAESDAQLRGDIQSAADYLLSAVALANALDHRPSFDEHFFANGVHESSSTQIERLLPTIRLCDVGDTIEKQQSCVSRKRIMELADRIVGEPNLQSPAVFAIHMERAIALDSLTEIANGNMPVRMMRTRYGGSTSAILGLTHRLATIVKPLFVADALFALQNLDRVARAASEPTWTRARKLIRRTVPPGDVFDEWMHAASRMVDPDLGWWIVMDYRAAARRRMAVLALAIRLYELDHGKRPESLAELVPDYLDALPIDPFGDGKQTFGYLPNVLWPRIYTLGSNGMDDDGEVAFRANIGVDRRGLDPPFFLDGPAPKTKEEFQRPRGSGERPADDDH